MSIGVFQLVKNEALWIGPWLCRLLPHVEDIVLFDGNSTDGTLEIIANIKKTMDPQSKVRVFENRDPADLRDDYVRLFDQAMRELRTDLAWFLHPDMWICNPERIAAIKESDAIAMYCCVDSFAGEPGAQPMQFLAGRADRWKNIYRLRNPDLGAHYWGWYGAADEDVYFSNITGKAHQFHARMEHYPYPVLDSGIQLYHYSDVRPYERRLERMKTCLRNQGYPEADVEHLAEAHPRVTLVSSGAFKLAPAAYPMELLRLRERYSPCRG